MTLRNRLRLAARPVRLFLPALLLLPTARVAACDACNAVLSNELASSRADSLVAEDVRRASENQASLLLRTDTQSRQEPPAPDITGNDGDGVAASNGNGNTDAAAMVTAMAASAAHHAMSAPGVAAGPAPSPRPRGPLTELELADPHADILRRDHGLSIPLTSYVPQGTPPDKSFTIVLNEGSTYLGNGVVYQGFLTNSTVPGPTIVVDEGDIVEFVVENRGTVPHGASIHAAYTQTSKYLGKINPGETRHLSFRASYPGVYMYHCAPGGHAIPMHVLFGQYGMMVVKPKPGSYRLERELGREPDLEIYLVQHEWYASGKDAIEGNPSYVTYNGKLFRYVEEPLVARPGDFVRIHFLNIGPNQLATFHIVGIIWDYAYWQGHPDAVWPGGQSVTAGPTDAWTVEFRVPPDTGAYTLLSHVVGSTSRGAIGLLVADDEAPRTPSPVLAQGPSFSENELAARLDKAVRVISPFAIGTAEADEPQVVGPGRNEVTVRIIGNSFSPKVLEITPGTTVTWVNEDVFAYLAGEYSGVHNVSPTSMPEADEEGFGSPLLVHGERFTHTFNIEGTYDYTCTPHPYMKGRVIVKAKDWDISSPAGTATAGPRWLLPLVGASFLLAALALLRRVDRAA